MLKENYFESFILLFVGIMLIYITNKPPEVIVKLPKISDMESINCVVDNNILSHAEFCEKQ